MPIPEDLAHEFGIHKGSQIDWVRTEKGTLELCPARTARQQAIDRLLGSLKDTVKPGESGMEQFLKWRQEERVLDYSYQNS